MPLMVLGGFGGVWGLMRVGMVSGGQTVEAIWSPDGHYRARLIQFYGTDNCAPGDTSFVLVERRSFGFYSGSFPVICSVVKPDRIHMRWDDAHTLRVECNYCPEEIYYADRNWGGLRLSYDFERPLGGAGRPT